MNRLVVISASLIVVAVLTVSGKGPPSADAAKSTWPADISLSPSVASAGEQVVVQGHGPSTPDGAECVVTVAGSPVTEGCTINGSGAIAASLHVPPDLPAATVTVAVCWPGCDADTPPPAARDYWQADATLVVAQVVPDVHGSSADEAAKALAAKGFSWRFEPSPPAAGALVSDEQPAAGSTAPAGTEIVLTMTVLATEKLFEVPDVAGQRRADAVKTLTKLTLKPVGNGADDDIVTGQEPAPHTRVPEGTTVTLQAKPTNTEPRLVQVPTLLGQSVETASVTTHGAGLTLQVKGEIHQGTVAAQNPTPDTMVNPGTPVTVTLLAAAGGPGHNLTSTDTTSTVAPTTTSAASVTSGASTTPTGAASSQPTSQPSPGSSTAAQPDTLGESSDSTPWGWPALSGVVLLLGLAGGSTVRTLRQHRRARRWVDRHITVRLGPGRSSTTTSPAGDRPDDHCIRIVAHPHPRSTTIQEAIR